jgi:hypothetical protein
METRILKTKRGTPIQSQAPGKSEERGRREERARESEFKRKSKGTEEHKRGKGEREESETYTG